MTASEVLRHPIARATRRRDDLGLRRAESRVSAYVYGAVLILATTAGVTPGAVRSGEAALLVAGAAVSTYVAHVLADVVGASLAGGVTTSVVVAELRDSLPVLSAGVPSWLLFAAAGNGWPSASWAQVLGCALLILRVGSVGLVYRRLREDIPIRRAVAFGVVTALVAALAAVVKLSLTH